MKLLWEKNLFQTQVSGYLVKLGERLLFKLICYQNLIWPSHMVLMESPWAVKPLGSPGIWGRDIQGF